MLSVRQSLRLWLVEKHFVHQTLLIMEGHKYGASNLPVLTSLRDKKYTLLVKNKTACVATETYGTDK